MRYHERKKKKGPFLPVCVARVFWQRCVLRSTYYPSVLRSVLAYYPSHLLSSSRIEKKVGNGRVDANVHSGDRLVVLLCFVRTAPITLQKVFFFPYPPTDISTQGIGHSSLHMVRSSTPYISILPVRRTQSSSQAEHYKTGQRPSFPSFPLFFLSHFPKFPGPE